MIQSEWQPKGSHYISGAYLDDTSGEPMSSLYPATGREIANLHAATPKTINLALDDAKQAQEDWAKTSPPTRGRILMRTAQILRERNRELSVLETMDTGKPLQETLVADATTAADCFEYFGALACANSFEGRHIPLDGDNFAYTIREPLGVCLGLGAWNYPIQTGAWKIAPALALGNAIVFKPSELTPLSALALAEIMTEAGLPPALMQVVQGAGEVGATLVKDKRIDKVSLTGSVETGQKIATSAGASLKKVTLELGGKSPLIVCEDADLQEAVTGALLANFYSSGQVCSNATRVFVSDKIKQKFINLLLSRTEKILIGDPMDESTTMGPLISEQQRSRVLNYIASGKKEGAKLLCGGNKPILPGFKEKGFDSGFFIEPTIFDHVEDSMVIAQEEIFGPVLCLLSFRDEDEVVERANSSEFGLSAGVFSSNIECAHRIASRFKAGSCWINSYNATAPGVPFGGYKNSGIGRENSRETIEAYSQIKSVYVQGGKIESSY